MGQRRADEQDSLFDLAPVALCVVSDQGRVLRTNRAASRLLGPTATHAGLTATFTGADGSRIRGWLRQVAASGPQASVHFVGTANLGGVDRTLELSGTKVPAGVLLSLSDVTAQLEQVEALTRRATTDPLTGLANRLVLEDRLEQLRRSTHRGLVALLDLDQFKEVNDRGGHEAGDWVLIETARRVLAHAPAGATVARVGGDEFVVLLPSATMPRGEALVNQMLAAVSEPVAGVDTPVSFCAGLAAVTGAASMAAVLRDADLALYRAKADGAGTVRRYDADVAAWSSARREADELARLRQRNADLFAEARTDEVTGLANPRSLREDLGQLVAAARVDRVGFALVFCDVDRFGAYNRRHGHVAGDRALRAVAEALTRACRDSDTVYRKGGEELVALLPGADQDTAQAVAERLREAVEAMGLVHGGHLDTPLVTISAGVAVYAAPALPGPQPALRPVPLAEAAGPDTDMQQADAVMAAASAAMLRAKDDGRNRVAGAPTVPAPAAVTA